MTATPTATPHLLETYADARLLWLAKGWGLEKAGKELAKNPELKHFGVSQPTFSKKTKPGLKVPIEPELAAAIENLMTWPGYERQVEIVTRGLLALHGAVPGEEGAAQGEDGAASGEDVAKVLKELRDALPGELVEALEEKASAREGKLIDALEEKAGAREGKLLEAVARLGRTTWKRVAIFSGLGALVGCLILVPFIIAAVRPPAVIFIPPGGPDTSPTWYSPGDLLALSEWGETRPLDQQVPFRTLPGQKVAPCDEGLAEEAINGNCWTWLGAAKPPCGRLFRHGDKCYRPIAADPKRPVEPGPDH